MIKSSELDYVEFIIERKIYHNTTCKIRARVFETEETVFCLQITLLPLCQGTTSCGVLKVIQQGEEISLIQTLVSPTLIFVVNK